MTSTPVNVHIRRNSDGVVQVQYWPEYGWDSDNSDYIWADGNYACDCNRFLFFERATGKEPEWDEGPCGDSAYSVAIFDMTGKQLYADDSWDSNGFPSMAHN